MGEPQCPQHGHPAKRGQHDNAAGCDSQRIKLHGQDWNRPSEEKSLLVRHAGRVNGGANTEDDSEKQRNNAERGQEQFQIAGD
jgi:hypothetical protein